MEGFSVCAEQVSGGVDRRGGCRHCGDRRISGLRFRCEAGPRGSAGHGRHGPPVEGYRRRHVLQPVRRPFLLRAGFRQLYPRDEKCPRMAAGRAGRMVGRQKGNQRDRQGMDGLLQGADRLHPQRAGGNARNRSDGGLYLRGRPAFRRHRQAGRYGRGDQPSSKKAAERVFLRQGQNPFAGADRRP